MRRADSAAAAGLLLVDGCAARELDRRLARSASCGCGCCGAASVEGIASGAQKGTKSEVGKRTGP